MNGTDTRNAQICLTALATLENSPGIKHTVNALPIDFTTVNIRAHTTGHLKGR